MFRAAALGFVAAATVALGTTQAQAGHKRFYYSPPDRYCDGGYRGGYYDRHDDEHDYLEPRAFHRELEHREAHRYPMTRYEDERVHDELDHEAYHDRLQHRDWHRDDDYDYAPSYGRGFSIGGGSSRFYFQF